MPASAAECSEEAFAFIERIDQIETAKQVIDAMMHSLSLFGIDYFIVTGLPNHRERFEQSVILRKWPVGWFELYARKDYVRVDPVIRRCRETVQPFEWAEAPYDSEREPGAREVMERAADFGMRRGFSLPCAWASWRDHMFLDERIAPWTQSSGETGTSSHGNVRL